MGQKGGNMKKFTKSVLAMLMMVCMLFGLTACGGDTTTDPTPTPVEGDQVGEVTPEPTEPAEPKEIVTTIYKDSLSK